MAVNEDLARWILESMDDVVTLEDLEGRLVYVSPSVRRLTGFAAEELLGTRGTDLAHPGDAPPSADGAAGEAEFRCRTRDGPPRWVAARSRTLCDEAGRPFRVLRCLHDVTERRQREEARRLEAVARLAGGVAHDFNNLLTIITGYACLLLEAHGPGDPDHEALAEMRRAADRAAERVRQLLAVASRQMLSAAPVDLNAVLRRLTEVFKRMLGPGVRLSLNLDPSLPRFKVDRGQLEEVLLVLAANARDAMPAGGEFTLTTAGAPAAEPLPPGPAVRLTVADTGRGMDEEVLAHLFEPFFTTKEVGRGSGLNLAAVRGIVRQSGGHITVASRPGAGSVFTLTFPAVCEAPRPAERDSSEPEA